MSIPKKENFISESILGIKSQKDIILEKIHRIKSYNKNFIKEYIPNKKNNTKNNNLVSPFYCQSKNIVYDSNHNSTVKKVFIKPVVKKNRIYITNKKKYHTNNCTINQNLNFSQIKKLNKNNNNINNEINNNKSINIKNNNKTIINNENSLYDTNSDYENEKMKNQNNNNVFNKNNFDNDNNVMDKFYTIKNEKRNNNIINLKNKNVIHNRKKASEINQICLKNNNNININILDKMNCAKGKDSININSINLISNNNINRINNPAYLNKLFSLSNTINDTDTINHYHETMNTDYNIKTQKVNKKLKKRFLLNDTKSDINKTNEECHPHSNYYSSITEVNPNSLIEEIELTGLNLKRNNYKYNKSNYLETKKKILISIENEKQKIIDESFKNYRKYLYLIQKQQQEYEEYDKYLKNELYNNLNNQRKLKIFKDKLKIDSTNTSYFNLLKNKKLMMSRTEGSPSEKNKTLSSKNFDRKHKNEIMKKFILPHKNMCDERRLLTTTSEAYEPLFMEDNESKIKYNLKNNNIIERQYNPLNKKLLKLNIDDIKKFKKIEVNNKNKNKKNNYHSKIKNKTINSNNNNNTNNKNKIKKNISNININYFSSDKLKKTNKKISTDLFRSINNYKNNNELENFLNNHKYKLSSNNIKKKLLLKKLMKNIKNEKDKTIKIHKVHKKSISNSHNLNIKCKSLRKLENYTEYVDPALTNSVPLVNNKEIHKMISEEKKKVLNRFNNLFKNKNNKNNNNINSPNNNNTNNINNNEYYSESKNYEKNNIIINNIIDDKYKNSHQIKNGLYYSAFKINKFEQNYNNNN